MRLGDWEISRESAAAKRCPAMCRALVLALAFLPLPAMAADSDAAEIQTLIQEPLSLYKTADMEFGQISPRTAGTVTITADGTNTCTITGTMIRQGPCIAATFSGYGRPNRFVRMRNRTGSQITLNGPAGATMLVDNFLIDSDGSLLVFGSGNPNSNGFVRYRNTSADGLFNLRVGATLHVAADQTPGLYTGTFEMQVAYN